MHSGKLGSASRLTQSALSIDDPLISYSYRCLSHRSGFAAGTSRSQAPRWQAYGNLNSMPLRRSVDGARR